MSEYPWNEKNNTFTWLSSLYNLFKLCQLFFKSNFILAWRKQIFSCITFPQKSRIQSLPLILDLRQFVFPSFWWWFLHSLSSAKTTLAFLNFTVLSQQVQFLLMYPTWKVWYPPLCIIWKISSITLMHSNWWCMWFICINYIISSYNLVLLLELLHLLQRHLSDQVYKLLQCNFILLYVIVQRVKVSVAILTDLNLLPYQTAIIQWRNFNKDMYKL